MPAKPLKKLSTKLKRLLPNNRFARSVSVLAGGTAAGQLIVIAASPILTRLYTPEDFGLLAVYAAILGLLSVVASLRYQLAIPLPESDKEAASIAVLSLLAVVVTTLFTAVVVWLFGAQIVKLVNAPGLAPYLWLVPTGLFLLGIYQIFQYWAIRTSEFSNIARTRLTQSLGMVVTQIVGYSLGPIALLLGRVVGQSAGIIGLARSAFNKNSDDFRSTTVKDIKYGASKYRNFPIISTWTGLASSAGLNLPPLFIAGFLGVSSAGLFSLAHRVLSQPMAVIGKAVSDAFYQKAAQANREGNLGDSVESIYSILVKLALPPAITIFIAIPDVFIFVFGAEWALAGELARWMTPWLFFQFVVSPCTGIYPIIDRHDIALRFQLSLLASSVLGSIVGGLYFDSLISVVIIISILSSFVYLWRAITTFKVVGRPASHAFLYIVKSIPLSILINIPLLVYYEFLEYGFLSFIFVVFVTVIFWLLFLVRPLWKSHEQYL